MGLISVAVALPIDMFLARAFEIANEGDAPESWLDAPPGRVKLIIGKDAHQGWHLANPSEPVSDFVLWIVRYGWESTIASLLRLAGWLFRRWCPCCASKEANDDEAAGKHVDGEDEDEPSAAPSGASNASSAARADARSKRLYASAGLLGVYICWVRCCACDNPCKRLTRSSHASAGTDNLCVVHLCAFVALAAAMLYAC